MSPPVSDACGGRSHRSIVGVVTLGIVLATASPVSDACHRSIESMVTYGIRHWALVERGYAL
ncbi:hypothetical protein [Nostoc sp. ATCC 53789]|uniref:hypothetical protein n=1 Tax=Nostoc sp. ATCC 53789 TaxID=76335 RepID=UPI0011BE0BF1|nr:hypothetical protein [Nostoc sp. ATCC 53789]QHG21087.1 hypothetical protein GJB62_35140 [Nostoc sp. ATCC 53789]